jgi:putative flippase GtrA
MRGFPMCVATTEYFSRTCFGASVRRSRTLHGFRSVRNIESPLAVFDVDRKAPARFLGVGVLNTLAGLAIIYAAKGFLRLDDITSNVLGYGGGLALSFVLNRRWTFRHTGAAAPALFKFLATVAVAYGANLVTVMAAIHSGMNGYVAQALGVPLYTAITYWGSRRYAFADTAPRRAESFVDSCKPRDTGDV